mmetsp:Transcript_9262/g.23229  ORF Transcript_9262/g.23229 Transcript_9262/m.23229 type:complete len:268 (-) Transcript_9262:1294-2097(-)
MDTNVWWASSMPCAHSISFSRVLGRPRKSMARTGAPHMRSHLHTCCSLSARHARVHWGGCVDGRVGDEGWRGYGVHYGRGGSGDAWCRAIVGPTTHRVDSLRVWHQRVFERTVARERPADVEAALPTRHVHGGPAMLICDVKVASPAVLHQVTHHGRVALLAGPEHRSPLRRVASGRARRRAVVEEPLDDLKVSVHACPRHAVPSRLVGDADILRRAVRVQELGDREVTVVAGWCGGVVMIVLARARREGAAGWWTRRRERERGELP